MPRVSLAEYTFDGLYYPIGGAARDPGQCPSLCYLVALTDSLSHHVSDTLVAKRILSWLYDFEEQALNAEHLRAGEEFVERYFVGGFHPQTPCMVAKRWSPISAMLERGIEPRILNREAKWRAVATGIWEPPNVSDVMEIETARTDDSLFWAIVGSVSTLAVAKKMWISVIAKPGWDYAAAINSLPAWPTEEIAKSGRVLWKRTSEG